MICFLVKLIGFQLITSHKLPQLFKPCLNYEKLNYHTFSQYQNVYGYKVIISS